MDPTSIPEPQIFLINLDRSADRLAFITEQAASLGFAFERIPAVDGRNLPDWLKSEFPADCKMGQGAIGCFASHLLAAQAVVARALPFAIILEDDAELQPGFVSIAKTAIAALPDNWDYLYFCSAGKKSVIRVCSIGSEHSVVRYTWAPANTVAYALSNRGARKRLAVMPRVRPIDIDNRFAWQQNLKIYGVFPAVVRQQREFVSTIKGAGSGVRWEPSPLAMFAGYFWTIREVGVRNFFAAAFMNLVNSARKRFDGIQRIAIISDLSGLNARREPAHPDG